MPGAGRRRAVMSISCRDEIGIVTERPETWVTLCTGHMGNTFRPLAGGVDAVEGVFGRGAARGRPPAWPNAGRGHAPGHSSLHHGRGHRKLGARRGSTPRA